jgi:hypothetical protein
MTDDTTATRPGAANSCGPLPPCRRGPAAPLTGYLNHPDSLDAPEILPAGACYIAYGSDWAFPSQQIVFREGWL